MSNADDQTVERGHGGHRKGAGRPKGARNKAKRPPTITVKKKLGGRREGAGRPVNSGPFKQATKAVRIPISALLLVESILHAEKICLGNSSTPRIPIFFQDFVIDFLSLYEDSNNIQKLDSYLLQWKEELATMKALYF